MKKDFFDRLSLYFSDKASEYINLLNKPCTQGIFLNTNKADKETILSLIDFDISESPLTDDSYYHNENNIGKTKVYDLGLVYPQEIGASLTTKKINKDIKTIVDLCAAPGGKTINVLNRVNKDAICISNDVSHSRALVLSQNLERLGLDNVIVTNKDCDELANKLEDFADLVILDAPCSGEGMIRKYPEILEEYSLNNIESLSKIQENLLEDAYRILKGNGQLIYSTCTYAPEEDEKQVINFLSKHLDMYPVDLGDCYESRLMGTVKLSPLQNTEGQFFALLQKEPNDVYNNLSLLKPVKDKVVDNFIKDNLNINEYYLYKNNEHYYLSLKPLFDLGNNVIKYGIYLGDMNKNRFEPNHNLYRANSLIGKYKYVYELNDEEYNQYISGLEIPINVDNNYYLLTYKELSIGFGKVTDKRLKNKYPKGLRRTF